jgi:hypothetical protein
MIDIIPSAKVNIVLDASKIDLFETCPARYNFRHNLNKTLPMMQKAKSLDKGSLIHGGFEVYFKELANGTNYNDRMQAAQMKINMMGADPNSSNSDPEDVREVISAFEQSCDYWRAEDENCLEILGVEEPFAYVLFEDDDIRIIISGKIDLLVNFNAIGRGASYKGMPMDHKSFQRDSPLLRKSNQFINYCNAVKSNYLMVNRVGLQKTLKAEDKFKRIPLSYDPVYIADWRNNLITMLTNEYLSYVAAQKWPEKPTSCNKFNRLCEYYVICDSSGQDSKEFKLESDFIDGEPWDVTKSLTSPSD